VRPIRAVTLDAYGTVFDFESHLPAVARAVLAAERVEGVCPERLARSWGAKFYAHYEEFGRTWQAAGLPFKTIADLTAEALAAAYRELGLSLDPWPGTRIWIERLRGVEVFPEIGPALAALAGRFELAMLSDTDEHIIAPALARHRLPLRFVLTSEGVRCYKQDPRAVLFKQALAVLNLSGEEVVHVGDSAGDVAGARRAGMRVVWVNRFGRKLPTGCPRPDREVPDLSTLAAVVESLS
jgi:2-haloalkanoic acid dehalogenase type II